MPRYFKVLAVVLFMLFAAGPLVAQEQPKAAATAFLLTTFLGFGSGRYYCGANGIGFLVADSIGVGLMAYGLASGTSTSSFGAALTGAAYIELGGIVFLISRVAQIIDIFGVIDEARKAGRIADVAPVDRCRHSAHLDRTVTPNPSSGRRGRTQSLRKSDGFLKLSLGRDTRTGFRLFR